MRAKKLKVIGRGNVQVGDMILQLGGGRRCGTDAECRDCPFKVRMKRLERLTVWLSLGLLLTSVALLVGVFIG